MTLVVGAGGVVYSVVYGYEFPASQTLVRNICLRSQRWLTRAREKVVVDLVVVVAGGGGGHDGGRSDSDVGPFHPFRDVFSVGFCFLCVMGAAQVAEPEQGGDPGLQPVLLRVQEWPR